MIGPQPVLESYLWTFPGCPVQISINLDVVECLSHDLGRSTRETGGLLLGYAALEAGRKITIARRVSLPSCFHAHRFMLSPEEISKLESRLFPDKYSAGFRIVGYYRTQLNAQPHLTKEDLDLITQSFQDPASVFLIVNPTIGKTPVAGFFFRDQRGIFDAFSFLEFPLDRRILAAGACLHEAPLCVTEIAPDEETAVVNSKYLRTHNAPDEQAGYPARRNRAFLRPGILAVCLLFIIVVAALLPRVSKRKAPFTATAPLQLWVRKERGDLRISWDTKSSVIRAAQSGRLVIDDGSPKHENLTLGPVELQSGPILYSLYSSRSTSMRFRLEINGPNGSASSPWIGVTLAKSDLPAIVESPDRGSNAARSNVSFKRFLAPPIPEAESDASGIAPPPLLPAPNLRGIAAPLLSHTAILPAPSLPRTQAPDKPVFTAPVLLKRVAPEFPVTLRHYSINGVRIHVLLQIDESGRVTGGRALTAGNQLTDFLSTVALESAKRWRFAPARLGEKNVPGEAIADFVFSNKP